MDKYRQLSRFRSTTGQTYPCSNVSTFQQSNPEIKINSITIAQDPEASSSVNIAKEGARRGHNMMVNPYTARSFT